MTQRLHTLTTALHVLLAGIIFTAAIVVLPLAGLLTAAAGALGSNRR